MEIHAELLKQIEDSPMDINAIVTKRRRDFTGEFFRYLSVVQETHDRLEDRDGIVFVVSYNSYSTACGLFFSDYFGYLCSCCKARS